MRHIVDAIAAQGRNGDDTLIHVSKKELRMLKDIGDQVGIKSTHNPKTGLPEAFNWLGTLGGIAGGIAGTFVTPGAGTAAGAALGSGLGTAAGGGTLQQSLTTGLISGVTAYAGGAALGSMSEAGAGLGSEAISNTVAPAVVDNVAPAVVDTVAPAVVDTAAPAVVDNVTPVVTDNVAPVVTDNVAPAAVEPTVTEPTVPQDTGIKGPGLRTPQAGGDVGLKMPQAGGDVGLKMPEGGLKTLPPTKPEFSMENVSNYLKDTPTKDIVKQYGADFAKTAMGAGVVGATPVGSSEPIAIPGRDTEMKYKADYYLGPEGEIRTRAVPMARGGEVYGDYDGVEDQAAGGLAGFAQGGVARYSGGGIGLVRSLQPGGQWGGMTADMYGAVQEQKPQWLQNIEPGGFIGATVPGKMDYEDKKRAEEEAKAAEAEQLKKAALAQSLKQQQDESVNRAIGMAAGGIASFGKGRYLQGPGDGMSDSIPADIDGKQSARLATGEFVVSADVVSGLGNGDSTAGAKQLHKMMDRVRLERTGTKKQGKQINPRKVMPT